MPKSSPKPHRLPEPSRPGPTGAAKEGGALDEVDRALSVLGGRHPEHGRAQRELREAGERRRVALGKELAEKAKMRRRRARRILAVAAVVVVVGALASRFAARTASLGEALAETEARWTALGFSSVTSNELSGRPTLEADLPGASCFVAVTTRDERLRVSAGTTVADGPRSVAWCECASSHATVQVDEGGPVGLAILRVDARELGGALARPWAPFTPGVWGDGGEKCQDATLDAWVADHRMPAAVVDTSWLESSPLRAPLKRAGFRVLSGVEAARPFGAVEAKAGDCVLAVARDESNLSLRAPGGAWRISGARKAMAWCTSTDATATVWRDGASPVVVVSAPAARVGGLLGVRECAEAGRLQLAQGATWIDPADLAWDAASVLRASTSLAATPSPLPPEPGSIEDSRVVAVALSAGAKLAVDPPSVVFTCDPPVAAPSEVRDAVCASTAPVSWWHRGDAAIGAARSTLPVWLSPLEARHEVDAIARIPELLALARRLGRERFEPTMLEGVTELPDGVRVIGRAGEDAVVAVGLDPSPPWVAPYYAPGPGAAPWDLGDEPRVVPLAPGKSVTLVSSVQRTTPLEKRRTVVFRRAVQLDRAP